MAESLDKHDITCDPEESELEPLTIDFDAEIKTPRTACTPRTPPTEIAVVAGHLLPPN